MKEYGFQENPHGVEALAYIPFREIAIDKDSATKKLTKRSRRVIFDNFDQVLYHLDNKNPDHRELKKKIIIAKREINQIFTPGGLALDDKEINLTYNKYGSESFQNIVSFLMVDVFPQFYSDKKYVGNPGVTNLNYLMDLQSIINPAIATYDETTESIIRAMRATDYALQPIILGGMVDDTIHARTRYEKAALPLEVLADREGAKFFEASFKRKANQNERTEFQQGIDITMADLLFTLYGITLN